MSKAAKIRQLTEQGKSDFEIQRILQCKLYEIIVARQADPNDHGGRPRNPVCPCCGSRVSQLRYRKAMRKWRRK